MKAGDAPLFLTLAAVLAIQAAPSADAKVIGMNTPAPALTEQRMTQLPRDERALWAAYLARSEAQHSADRASLAAELKPGQPAPPASKAVGGDRYNMPLDRDAAWYASDEAKRIADTIISFQTPAGGWSKNQDRAGPQRLPGQRFSNDAETMTIDPANFDVPRDRFWTFVGTIDNDATTTEIRFLARVAAARGAGAGAYRASIVKGVGYLLAAQYPNGGWPQNWPLEGGFHDGITFNDNGVAKVAMLLEDVAGDADYRFVPAELRSRSAAAVEQAIALILRAQVRVAGERTGWPQQVDALTLAPISARNYEPRSIASGETTDILFFLMRQPKPSAEVRAAIEAGVAWLREKAVRDVAFTGSGTPEGRRLIARPGGGPLWSRNYDIVTGKPIFGDRDRTIHDDVNGISIGRRNGYSWWLSMPERVIAAYPAWRERVGGAG